MEIVKPADAKPNRLTLYIVIAMVLGIIAGYFINENATIEAFNEILPSLNEVFIRHVEGTKTSRPFQNVAV